MRKNKEEKGNHNSPSKLIFSSTQHEISTASLTQLKVSLITAFLLTVAFLATFPCLSGTQKLKQQSVWKGSKAR